MDPYFQSDCFKSFSAVDYLLGQSNISRDSCLECFSKCWFFARDKAAEETREEIRNGAMRWIGVYVAVASLICSLAMAADVFHGFRHKKLWFPCKFFTLNALFLTLLAVVTKLVVDLSTDMRDMSYPSDMLVKISSSVFICTTIGIGIGTIACAFRVFNTIKLKCSGLRGKSFKTEFKIEEYWIKGLVEWKQKPLPLNIRSKKWKKLVHNTKNLLLIFCIRVQILIVVVSKSIQLLLVFLFALFLKRKLVPNSSASSNYSSLESSTARKMDLTRYVLLLEGENELPERTLNNICDSAERLIQMGKKQQPKNLKELLKISTSFKGVAEFDNDQIPSLVSYDPPNSWMMPLVTLTCIAIALPNITNQMIEGLISSASEGLIYIDLVEKDLDGKGDLMKVRNAAKVIWLEVELHRTWLDQDLSKMDTKEKNSKAILESLADRAKKSVEKFKEKANKIQKENPLQWPVEAIAANSMYRISNTLLLEFDLNNELSEEELFKKLHVMISDILSACLTNLPRVITMKCFCNVVEKREESVQQAAHLLGEAEEILKILQQRELPSLNHDQAACIDEWRAIIKQDHNLVFASSSSNDDTASSGSGEIHLDVEKEAC